MSINIQKVFISTAKGVIYGNIGSSYLKLKKDKEAVVYLKKSLFYNKEDKQDAMYNKIKLGKAYLMQGKNKEVLKVIKEINIEVKKHTYYPLVNLRLQELTYQYYESLNDTKNALKIFKNFIKDKDSISKVRNKVYKDINLEFAKLTKDDELLLLKKNNNLKTIYLIFTIITCLLTTLSILLILKNVRNTKANLNQLKFMNSKILAHNLMMEKTLMALEESQEENSNLMQIVAHDMRTPIEGIIGLTSLLLEEKDLKADQYEVLNMINISSKDALIFINNLLQSQYNKTNLIKEPVELDTLLKYCITLLSPKAIVKDQKLRTLNLYHVEIYISREKIWRVISNLIANAIKFSPHHTTITINMEKKASSIVISVKDQGIGIPLIIGDKLFDMAANVQRPGTDGEKSYGLGLAISKQIIETHNGSIWFESLPNLGTTFFIELPLDNTIAA